MAAALRGARRALAAGLLAIVSVSVPMRTPAAVPAQPVLTFGAAVSFTGKQSKEGRLTQQGYDFWANFVNTHGGLKVGATRYKVVMRYGDDQSSPPKSAAVIEHLITDEHADFLLGPYGSPEAFAAAAVAERHGVPMVTSGSAAERTFNQGYRYIFGVQSPARKYLAGIIEFAVRRTPTPRTVAIGAAEDAFSREIQQGAVQSANDHGLHVVYAGTFKNDPASLQSVAAQMVAARPDVILGAGHLQDVIDLQRAVVANHAHALIYGYSVGPDAPQFRTALGRSAQAVLGCAQWSPAVTYVGDPGFYATAHAYTVAYTREVGHIPGYLDAEATAAGVAYIYALAAAGTTDHAAVRDALARLNVMTFFGPLKFDERGVNMYKPMVVNQIQGDNLVTIYPYRLANARPIYPAPDWSGSPGNLPH